MPERGFLTETWDSDDWFQELSRDQRYLFIYSWTNNHCNPAGLYRITLATMSFETKFPKEELPDLLKSLSPKIAWYPEYNLIWVKNFVRIQTKSPKFLIAVAKCLKSIRYPNLVAEFIEYNQQHSISIPYEYNTATVPIPPSASAGTDSISKAVSLSDKGRGIVKGEGGITTEEIQEIATLYEEEIGKIVPAVAQELKDAIREYPAEWIKEAIGEAACQNVRKWKYVVAILKRWKEEGKGK